MRWTDEQVERTMGTLLRTGVIAAAAVVLAGGIGYLKDYGSAPLAYHVFRGEPTELRSVTGVIRGAASLDSRSIVQFGLLLLIATPIARVAFSVTAFAAQRDSVYVGITLLVLAILIFSLAGGGVY